MERCLERVEAVMSICNDYQDSPADIIADLIHYCNKHNLDFGEIVQKAKDYVQADLLEEESLVTWLVSFD